MELQYTIPIGEIVLKKQIKPCETFCLKNYENWVQKQI